MPKGIPKNGINKGQWKKDQISPRKGILVSKETRQKMREKKLGRKVIFSDKHKENLSKSLMGRIGPLKGLKRPQFSKKWRENISKGLLGKPSKSKGKTWKIKERFLKGRSERMLGEKNPMFGRHLNVSKETRDKIGKANSGEKNWHWYKDRNKLKKSEKKLEDTQYKYWMLEVKKRDNWKCKLVNSDCSGHLESHHIFNWVDYPELRYIINNGITLCQFHHPKKWDEEKRMIPIFQELLSVSKE